MTWSPYWGTEDDLLELGARLRTASDGASSLEHRLCRANGETYGCPPRHWSWGAHEVPGDDVTERDTVALLTEAADLAENAAERAVATCKPAWSELSPRMSDRFSGPVRRLIAASGPDHWRAVAAMLRSATERHYQDAPSPTCVCGLAWRARSCGELTVLRPLAELVVQHLGDKTA